MSLKSCHIQNNEQLATFIDGLNTPDRLELGELTIDLSLKFWTKTLQIERQNLTENLQYLRDQLPLFSNLQAFTMFVDLPVPYPTNQNYFDLDLFNEITYVLDGREDWRGDGTEITMQGAVHGIYSFWSQGEQNVSHPFYSWAAVK